MKKAVCFAIALMMMVSSAFASTKYDFSKFTLEELISLRDQTNAEITKRQEAQQEGNKAASFFEKFNNDISKTPAPTATPEPFIKSNYGTFDYNILARYPENYKEKKIFLDGRVIQATGSRKRGYFLRVAEQQNSNNIFAVSITTENAPDFNILENDEIEVYGVFCGDYTYESTTGKEITIPSIFCTNVFLN